jgi:hypothetical protein
VGRDKGLKRGQSYVTHEQIVSDDKERIEGKGIGFKTGTTTWRT